MRRDAEARPEARHVRAGPVAALSALAAALAVERQAASVKLKIRDWIVHELAVSILRPRRTVACMILFRAMRRRDHNLYQAHEARLGNLYSALLVRPLRRRTRPTCFLQLEAFVLRTGQHLSAIMVFTRWLEHHSLVKAHRDHALARPSLGGNAHR